MIKVPDLSHQHLHRPTLMLNTPAEPGQHFSGEGEQRGWLTTSEKINSIINGESAESSSMWPEVETRRANTTNPASLCSLLANAGGLRFPLSSCRTTTRENISNRVQMSKNKKCPVRKRAREANAGSSRFSTKLTYLILDVLFPPLRGDVSREMLCEFHFGSFFSPLLFSPLSPLKPPSRAGVMCVVVLVHKCSHSNSPPKIKKIGLLAERERKRKRCPFFCLNLAN